MKNEKQKDNLEDFIFLKSYAETIHAPNLLNRALFKTISFSFYF